MPSSPEKPARLLSAPILALTLASFGIGTTEYVIMGLLPDLARDLSVSVPKAGGLVSGYALGVALGSPLVAVAMASLPRKAALTALVLIFLVGNVGCALAPDYPSLMAARIVTALAHGAFFGIAAVVAADLVSPSRRASAVALVFAGLTLANVLGVPFGTVLGQAQGWRATFWAVAGIGLLAAAATAVFLPAGLPGGRGNPLREFAALANPRVLLPMLLSTLASVSLFSFYTFISPFLREVAELSPGAVTAALLVFGAGLTAGNLVGGRLADWRRFPALLGSFALLAVVLAATPLAVRSPSTAMLGMAAWGAVSFALVPSLQIWVVDAAREAPNLASTLNQSAFNLGNSIGAAVGGAALTAGFRYADLPWLAAGFALLGFLLVLLLADRIPNGAAEPGVKGSLGSTG